MKLSDKIKILSLSIAVVLLLAGCGSSEKNENKQKFEKLPKFEFTSFDGKKITQKPFYKGTGIISFVASWCGPCGYELIQIDSLAKEYKNLFALAVTYESPDFYKTLLESLKISMPIATVDSSFFRICKVKNLPTRILVSKGKIISRTVGAPTPLDSQFMNALKNVSGISNRPEQDSTAKSDTTE
ncbi:redoxin domain-containing protein [bacterium]|nr:redoxin domain-containing protein [bacterium]